MTPVEIAPDIAKVKTDRDWLPAEVSQARQWLADGLSLTEIGRRLGRSKNSVVGKCHRDCWDDFTPYTPPPNLFPERGCLWPHGEPGEPGFGFCGAQVAAGHVFCDGHRKTAYTQAPKNAAAPELYE